MKIASDADKGAAATRPLQRLKARLDAGHTKRVQGSTPFTVREPDAHVAHQTAPVTTR